MDPVTVIFAGIAVFAILKLVSSLGTRTGHEQSHDIEGLQRARHADSDGNGDVGTHDADHQAAGFDDDDAPGPAPVSPAAEPLRAIDPDFDEAEFLQGARSAYEMIVEAFADGDLASVKTFLAPPVYDAFAAAVAERQNAGSRYELKFVGIESAEITEASAENGTLSATVTFASNQVRSHYDADGALIDGDPARIDLVRDAWTFSKSAVSSDPNWTLVATGG